MPPDGLLARLVALVVDSPSTRPGGPPKRRSPDSPRHSLEQQAGILPRPRSNREIDAMRELACQPGDAVKTPALASTEAD